MGATVHLLGTGTAFNTDGRDHQALYVEPEGGSPFLVDVGPTVMRSFASRALDHRGLDTLHLTHLHGDHTAGWPFLLLHLALADRRQRPLEIIGPLGTRDCLETLARTCYGELLDRPPFELRWSELEIAPGQGLGGRCGPRFDVLPMQHHPTSIGYRFELGSSTLGVSGDTAWSDDLQRLAAGCDLLLLECSSVEPAPGAHISLSELRERRGALGGCAIVLVHLTDEVAREMERQPIPGVRAGCDGERIEVG